MVIIDIAHRSGLVRLWCMDRFDQSRQARTSVYNEQALYIDAAGEIPALGDDVWCDSTTTYWTPKDGRFRDRPIRKIEHTLG